MNLVVTAEARALTASASGYRMDFETETFVVAADLRNGTTDDDSAMALQAGGMGTGRGRSINSIPHVVANGLRASDGHHGHSSPRGDGADNLIALETMGVRRLTPLECERLMGWPDEWTRWTADGREIPDSHRYRLCGNGVVSTVAEHIAHRLVAVDRVQEAHAA